MIVPVRVRIIVVIALILFAIVVYGVQGNRVWGKMQWGTASGWFGAKCEKEMLCVSFLDVGQGDAIFIESPSGTELLIDGGQGVAVLRELSRHLGFFDKNIDVLLATHPDEDHIGGLIEVLERYTVHTIIRTENESDTPASERFSMLVENEEANVFYARTSQTYDLGGGATLRILFPDRNPAMLESNSASIIAQLIYGETKFLFAGDSPQSVESYVVSLYGESLESDVLKVGHHGSKTSTAETFVSAVDPDYAVISAGKDNRYGHPHEEVVERLYEQGIEIRSTFEDGSITFVSDGQTMKIK